MNSTGLESLSHLFSSSASVGAPAPPSGPLPLLAPGAGVALAASAASASSSIRQLAGQWASLLLDYILHPLITILLCLLSVLIVLGNLLVVSAIWHENQLHSVTNYLIASLAAADCLVGALVMPFSIISEIIMGSWTFGPTWCDLWHSFDVLASTASIMNLCAISLDRYLAITNPISYPTKMTPKRVALLIVSLWTCSALISFPAIAWWRAVGQGPLQRLNTGSAGPQGLAAANGSLSPDAQSNSISAINDSQQHHQLSSDTPPLQRLSTDLAPHRPIQLDDQTQYKCVFTDDTYYLLFSSFISFYGPLCVMLYAYYRIYKAAVQQTRFLKHGSKQVMIGNKNKNNTRRHKYLMGLTIGAGSSTGAAGGASGAAGGASCYQDSSQLAADKYGWSEATMDGMSTTDGNCDTHLVLRAHRGGGANYKIIYSEQQSTTNSSSSRQATDSFHHRSERFRSSQQSYFGAESRLRLSLDTDTANGGSGADTSSILVNSLSISPNTSNNLNTCSNVSVADQHYHQRTGGNSSISLRSRALMGKKFRDGDGSSRRARGADATMDEGEEDDEDGGQEAKRWPVDHGHSLGSAPATASTRLQARFHGQPLPGAPDRYVKSPMGRDKLRVISQRFDSCPIAEQASGPISSRGSKSPSGGDIGLQATSASLGMRDSYGANGGQLISSQATMVLSGEHKCEIINENKSTSTQTELTTSRLGRAMNDPVGGEVKSNPIELSLMTTLEARGKADKPTGPSSSVATGGSTKSLLARLGKNSITNVDMSIVDDESSFHCRGAALMNNNHLERLPAATRSFDCIGAATVLETGAGPTTNRSATSSCCVDENYNIELRHHHQEQQLHQQQLQQHQQQHQHQHQHQHQQLLQLRKPQFQRPPPESRYYKQARETSCQSANEAHDGKLVLHSSESGAQTTPANTMAGATSTKCQHNNFQQDAKTRKLGGSVGVGDLGHETAANESANQADESRLLAQRSSSGSDSNASEPVISSSGESGQGRRARLGGARSSSSSAGESGSGSRSSSNDISGASSSSGSTGSATTSTTTKTNTSDCTYGTGSVASVLVVKTAPPPATTGGLAGPAAVADGRADSNNIDYRFKANWLGQSSRPAPLDWAPAPSSAQRPRDCRARDADCAIRLKMRRTMSVGGDAQGPGEAAPTWAHASGSDGRTSRRPAQQQQHRALGPTIRQQQQRPHERNFNCLALMKSADTAGRATDEDDERVAASAGHIHAPRGRPASPRRPTGELAGSARAQSIPSWAVGGATGARTDPGPRLRIVIGGPGCAPLKRASCGQMNNLQRESGAKSSANKTQSAFDLKAWVRRTTTRLGGSGRRALSAFGDAASAAMGALDAEATAAERAFVRPPASLVPLMMMNSDTASSTDSSIMTIQELAGRQIGAAEIDVDLAAPGSALAAKSLVRDENNTAAPGEPQQAQDEAASASGRSTSSAASTDDSSGAGAGARREPPRPRRASASRPRPRRRRAARERGLSLSSQLAPPATLGASQAIRSLAIGARPARCSSASSLRLATLAPDARCPGRRSSQQEVGPRASGAASNNKVQMLHYDSDRLIQSIVELTDIHYIDCVANQVEDLGGPARGLGSAPAGASVNKDDDDGGDAGARRPGAIRWSRGGGAPMSGPAAGETIRFAGPGAGPARAAGGDCPAAIPAGPGGAPAGLVVVGAPRLGRGAGKKLTKLAKERKAAKTLGIVVGVFILCWLPFFVCNIIVALCGLNCIYKPHILLSIVTWLGWLNSAMNPVIYACWSRDFRRAFRRVLCTWVECLYPYDGARLAKKLGLKRSSNYSASAHADANLQRQASNRNHYQQQLQQLAQGANEAGAPRAVSPRIGQGGAARLGRAVQLRPQRRPLG